MLAGFLDWPDRDRSGQSEKPSPYRTGQTGIGQVGPEIPI
ncbi:hypothetical protein TIFTF001_052227 [Ficus carica]|uniref:Uncharacterized protein n=1 Tax=Ficus carica TaxID=3494 RepID=A0AA88EI23_FICCA|nr:hypothetical protein TIFTF001_052227 [Ficus carica]